MKKKVIHINDMNMEERGTGILRHVSIDLYEGEIVSFLGLNYSGKDLLAKVLGGMVELTGKTGAFFAGNEKIRNREQLKGVSYRITPKNYEIRGWTVAEYVFMSSMKWILTGAEKRKMNNRLADEMAKFDLDIEPGKPMEDLDEVEKRAVDLVKAVIIGCRLVVLEDEFEGMNKSAIGRFAEIMKRVISGRIAAVVCSHSDLASYQLADSFMLFRNGILVKKFRKADASSHNKLEEMLFDKQTALKKRNLEREVFTGMQESEKEVIYSVQNFPIAENVRTDLEFRGGEITSVLALDMSDRKRIFGVLSGRIRDRETQYKLHGKIVKLNDSEKFLKHKIISASKIGTKGEDGVLDGMSVSDNLLIPSLSKVSPFEYMFHSQGLKNTVLNDHIMENADNTASNAMALDQNGRICIALERWLIFRPEVVIFLEPFSRSDAYGVSLIRSYMKKLVRQGASVIIVKSRHEYIDDISDHIIKADEISV